MSKNMDVPERKQSIIAGGSISPAGISSAKFIGLFYAVPYNPMPGAANNLACYGVAFDIYSYLLNICTAGFPFAIATLIIKYSIRGDYQTSLLIKRLSASLMTCFGFRMVIIVILFSSPLAVLAMPDEGDSAKMTQMVLILISSALFFVPPLSSIHGFYQRFKHVEIYVLSQVLEQVARVIFLLGVSAIAIYALRMDQAWAPYFDVIPTSTPVILAIMHLKLYNKEQVRELKRLVKTREVIGNNDRRGILKEFVFATFLYLIVAILGYGNMIADTLFLNRGLEAHGNTGAEILLISGSINHSVLKLVFIPAIPTPGFSSAIIPHIITALTSYDLRLVRKNTRGYMDIVLYIGLPISLCLLACVKPLYAILFPPVDPKNLELLVDILDWFSTETFLNTIRPTFTALLMVVGLRKLNIHSLVIVMVVKFSVVYPLLRCFGYQGVVMSSILVMGIFIILDTHALTSHYRIRWKYMLYKLLAVLLAAAALFAVARGCDLIGLKGYGSRRILSLLQLAVNESFAMLVCFDITYFFSMPRAILHLDLSRPLKRGKGRQAYMTG